jgi:hypothetical protein
VPFTATSIYVRSALRARIVGWLFLVVAIGLAAGVSIAAVAGGNRTLAAFDRFAEHFNAADVYLPIDCPERGPCGNEVTAVRAMPAVAEVTLVRTGGPTFRAADGRLLGPDPEDPCYSGAGAVALVASADAKFGSTVNRFDVRAGRRPDPTRADEVMIAGEIARRGVRVGDTISMWLDCGDESPNPNRMLRVVGIEESPIEAHGDIGNYLSGVHATPALLAELLADGARFGGNLAITLRPGVTPDTFGAQLASAGIHIPVVLRADEIADNIKRSVRSEAVTLWLVGLLSGIAAAVVLGAALVRQMLGESASLLGLRPLGFTRADLSRANLALAVVLAVGAAAIAAVRAVVVSMLTPLGEARRYEINPGVAVDAWIALLGIAATVLFIVVLVVAAGRQAAVSAPRRPHRGALHEWMVRKFRLSAAPSAGLRITFSPPGRATTLMLRCGLVGVVVGLAGVVAASIFLSGLAHVRNTPRLVGWNWDVVVPATGEPAPDFATTLLRAAEQSPSVERTGYLSLWSSYSQSVLPSGEDVVLAGLSTGPKAVLPTTTQGRAPQRDDEILLHSHLAARLGLALGDRLALRSGDASVTKLETYRIVGFGVLPIGEGRLETAMLTTLDGRRRVHADAQPDMLAVALRDGATPADLARDLAAAGIPPGAVSIEARGADVERVVGINLDDPGRAPWVLGLLLALMTLGVLVHTVVGAARAARRDLAVHNVLGFTRGQVVGAAATQATTVVAIALLFAVPLGIVGGVGMWNAYADSIGAVPETSVPVLGTVTIAAATLLGAALLAVPLGLRAAGYRSAALLRTE